MYVSYVSKNLKVINKNCQIYAEDDLATTMKFSKSSG